MGMLWHATGALQGRGETNVPSRMRFSGTRRRTIGKYPSISLRRLAASEYQQRWLTTRSVSGGKYNRHRESFTPKKCACE